MRTSVCVCVCLLSVYRLSVGELRGYLRNHTRNFLCVLPIQDTGVPKFLLSLGTMSYYAIFCCDSFIVGSSILQSLWQAAERFFIDYNAPNLN